MRTNLVWKAKEYPSLELCDATISSVGAEISSVIIGIENDKIFKIEYYIKTSPDWEAKTVEIKSNIEGFAETYSFQSNGKGTWLNNGQVLHQLDGCIDVDLTLTPFTNTLPINRLKLRVGEQQEIRVVYLDLLNNAITPVAQKYTRLSEFEYKYENVPNDFEAVIYVDESGFVVVYPNLFERITRRNSQAV